jgi:small subunit ribosomal protein S10
LPTKRTIYPFLLSPNFDKKTRELFETRAHKRLSDILNSNNKTIDSLSKLDIPAGVDIEIKL